MVLRFAAERPEGPHALLPIRAPRPGIEEKWDFLDLFITGILIIMGVLLLVIISFGAAGGHFSTTQSHG